MRKTIIIVYHSPCFDGHCAAWVANRVFRNRPNAIEFYPTQYGDTPIDIARVKSKEVYFLDFSYPLDMMQRVQAASASLVVLDHHKTAKEALSALAPRTSDTIRFDMNKSGARLTWEHFFPNVDNAHWLVKYTEDRDLWRHTLAYTKEVNAALASYPYDFGVWDDLAKKSHDPIALEGAAILRYQQQIIDKHVARARDMQLAGHVIRTVNAPYELSSDICNVLVTGYPFAATWYQKENGKFGWSLRSTDNGVDVSEIAKRYGGGGHRNAAGFESVTLDPDMDLDLNTKYPAQSKLNESNDVPTL